MAKILLITHRIPYPPNKGDKIRAFQLIQGLIKQGHKLSCAFPIEEKEDLHHVDALWRYCDKLIYPDAIKTSTNRYLTAIKGLFSQESLTKVIGFDPALFQKLSQQETHYDLVIFFSSVSFFYKNALKYNSSICDFVDMDSYKWLEYAQQSYFPLSWIYKREAKLLKNIEVDIVDQVDQSLFVTNREKQLFLDENKRVRFSKPIDFLECSVDTSRFNADLVYQNPFHQHKHQNDYNIVMTGAMDYKPNYEGALYFIKTILPHIQQKSEKNVNFYCVGRNPVKALKAHHDPNNHVVITGSVDDVRPFIIHSYACVAPLFIGRGIQNKVLEAMAMEKTCFVSTNALEGIDAQPNKHLILCSNTQQWYDHFTKAFNGDTDLKKIGTQAKNHVIQRYHCDFIQKKLNNIIDHLTKKSG